MDEPIELYSTAIDRDPFPFYSKLRDEYPCYWSPSANKWFLSRYDDVLSASQDWATYSSKAGNLIDEIPGRSGGTLGTTDPPRHDRLRALAQAAFAKKNLDHLVEPSIEAATNAIKKIGRKQEFDFVADFSSTVTVNTLFSMLGLPQADPVEIRKKVVLSISSDKNLRGRNETFNQAFGQLSSFIANEVEKRRRAPTNDLIALLAESEIDGDRLTDREVILTTTMFVVAGVESLSSFMSIFALNLAENTEARLRINTDPELMPQAIEESLRFNTSAQRFKRILTQDVEMHGQKMKMGDSVILAYGAANRDERKFPDPHIYDIDRNPKGHLGFGAGKHFCIGNSLARLVTQTTMDAFVDAFPNFAVTDQNFDWVPSSNFRSPVTLPMRI